MNNLKIEFGIIPAADYGKVIPFVFRLNESRISSEVLKQRFDDMKTQNYECLGIYYGKELIGVCGMWFQTRHYAGRSMELDHVIIDDAFRNKGIGKQMMTFIYSLARDRGCEWIELNTYVSNFPSHKFYYNEGFAAKGYHFVKQIN